MAIRFWRAAFVAALVAALYFALRPAQGGAWFPHADKLEHAFAFAALAAVGWRAGVRPAGLLLGFLVVFGLGIEVAQSFTVTRQAEFADLLADAMGAAAWVLYDRRRSTPETP